MTAAISRDDGHSTDRVGAGRTRPTLCFVCSPNAGIVDNWLPVIAALHASGRYEFVFVAPRASTIDEVDPANVLFRIASRIFGCVLFKSHHGFWLTANSFEEAKLLNALGAPAGALLRLAYRLEGTGLRSVASNTLKRLVRSSHAATVGGRAVQPSAVIGSSAAVLYDVIEEQKPYNSELWAALGDAPRFSICHGIDIHDAGRALSTTDRDSGGHRVAYLFSELERGRYEKDFGITGKSARVAGVPRHDPDWIERIVQEGAVGDENIGEGFVAVFSRPGGSDYFPRDRKLAAISDIRRVVVEELRLKLVVKLHPKERAEGSYERVLGESNYGHTWSYSSQHAFVLGRKCAFAITFYSGVSLDMLALKTPVIERLDLRGLPGYDNAESLRDAEGHPVFSYRYLRLVLGASDRASLASRADLIRKDRSGVVAQLVERYDALFPATGRATALVSQDIMSAVVHPVA